MHASVGIDTDKPPEYLQVSMRENFHLAESRLLVQMVSNGWSASEVISLGSRLTTHLLMTSIKLNGWTSDSSRSRQSGSRSIFAIPKGVQAERSMRKSNEPQNELLKTTAQASKSEVSSLSFAAPDVVC